jgi:polyhydroxyalkanoate synthesis regulator phasin
MSEEKPKKQTTTRKKAAEKPLSVKKDTGSKPVEAKNEIQDPEKAMIDPLAQMFQFYDTFAKSWSGVMSEAVASKSFAESMGRQVESSLDTMTLLRRQMGDLMEQYLQQMNLPTRREITNIAKRLTHLEMALDDLDAKMDEVLDLLKAKKK